MSDPNGPGPGGPASPEEHEPEKGALLFDPTTAALPDEELYRADEEWEDDVPSRPAFFPWVVGVVVLALAGAGAWGYFGGEDDFAAITETPELPPMVDPVATGTTAPAAIVPIPTDEFEGPVASEVLLAVRASGGAGVALADTVVRFGIESGGGILEAETTRTGPDGIATTSLRLPPSPGVTVVVVEVQGSNITAGRITAEALPGTPEQIAIVSGYDQRAEIGELLPTRVVIALTDLENNPVPGHRVEFEVTSGEGLVAPSRTRTDSLGHASALWRLGMIAGEQAMRARALGLGRSVTITARAAPSDRVVNNAPLAVESGPVTVLPSRFAVGGSHVCQLAAGTLSCRGGNDRGQIAVRGPSPHRAIAAGSAHTCGLDDIGVASCWGANEGGQLGDGSRTDRASATRVQTDLRFSALVTGSAHTCGLAGGGVPLCWGLNLSGQLGDGTRNDQPLPRTVGGGLAFDQLAAGWSHTCGLTANGNVFCWGLNSSGQLGDGSRLDRLVPTLVRGAVQALVAGSAHTCGITEGVVLCWGGNSFGQLGDGSAQDSSEPVEVQGIEGDPTQLASGAVHTCALVRGGAAYCWGQNLQGQLGDGSTQNRARAVPVAGDLSFSEIHAGGAQTCGTTTGGDQYCWGLNQSGQLGDGTRVSRSSPTRVGG